MSSRRIRLALFGALAVAAPALASPALAGPEAPRAVVELFTSQGCSSCPPADRLLNEIARKPGVIGLSLPVDYWDYLGWKDTLAKPEFSLRQRAYASARGDRQIFTPQVVINGVVPCVGSDRAPIEQEVAAPASLPVSVNVTQTAAKIVIEVGPRSAGAPESAELWVVPIATARQVAIGRGENRGRAVTYTNVVRGLEKVGAWTGAAARFEVPLATARSGDADTYVVLLQARREHGPGAIIGAARAP